MARMGYEGLTFVWGSGRALGPLPNGPNCVGAICKMITDRGLRNLDVLDICCGCGTIGLPVYRKLGPEVIRSITLSDVNVFNIDAARQTLKANGLQDDPRIKVYLSDGVKFLPADVHFDLVVSNPPHDPRPWQSFPEAGDPAHPVMRETLNESILGCHDDEWKFHQEFYADISGHLRYGGEVWFIENRAYAAEENVKPLIEANPDLEHVQTCADPKPAWAEWSYYWMISRRRDPLVTVILTSYNRPRLVVDAIESVQEQTLGSWQLLIADDDSDEETRKAILKAARGDPRIEILWSPRPVHSSERFSLALRYSARINDVIPRARGKYVCYLCDDDYLYPESLQARAEALEADPDVHVVYGRLRSISCDLGGPNNWDSNARPTPGRSYPRGKDIDITTGRSINPSEWSPGVLRPFGGKLDHNQVMHRRVCFDEMGGPPWWQLSPLGAPGDALFFKRLDQLGHGALAVDAFAVSKRYHALSCGRAGSSPERE